MNGYPVELLRDLCQIYSPSYQEQAAVQFMVRKAGELRMRSFVDGAGNFVAEKGAGKRTLLFLGHIDTVQGFIPIKIEDGKLYGRGSVDAKGSLAAFFVAASQTERLDDLRIVIVGAVEEEAPTSKGARFIIDKYKPDFVVVGEPSGVAGITLGYKGRLHLKYQASIAHRHTAAGGRGVAALGVNFWNKVERYCDDFNKEKGAFETLDPYVMSFNTFGDGFSDGLEVRMSFRTPLAFPVDEFKSRLRQMAGGSEPLEFYGIEEPFKAEKNNRLVRAFLQAIRDESLDPKFKVKTGTSDMNIVGPVWKCPILAYGPGDSKLDHTPQEHLSLEEYSKAISILIKVVKKISRDESE